MTQVNVSLFSEEAGTPQVEFFTEGSGSNKQFMFEGVFAQADVINGNGRVYPSKVMMPAVEQYIASRVDRNLAMGELDHPASLSVSMKNVSHLITELTIQGSNVIGKAVMTQTPMGEIARGLVNSGVQLSVSTRGGGKAHKSKGVEYMDMFVLTAVDIVSFPSAPDAFVKGIKENMEFMIESGMLSLDTADKTTNLNSLSSDEFTKLMIEMITEMDRYTVK